MGSSEKVAKLSLSEIVSISNQLVDKKSLSPFDLNPFHALFHPIQSFKKNYQVALVRRVEEIVVDEILPNIVLSGTSEEISASILKKLAPLETECSELQQIFQNVLKMAQRGEENRKRQTGNVLKRVVNHIISKICAPSIEKIKHRLDVELDKGGARSMAVTIIQVEIFKALQKAGATITLPEFVSKFMEKNDSLLSWCIANNLKNLALGFHKYQETWNQLKAAP